MWVAIIFGSVVALGLGAYAGWAAHAVGNGAALWAFVVGLPFAYLAFPLLATTIWMSLGWWWRAPRPPEATIGPAASVRLFWTEFKSIAQAPKMIFYALLMRDPPPGKAALPVLLLHGIGCNA